MLLAAVTTGTRIDTVLVLEYDVSQVNVFCLFMSVLCVVWLHVWMRCYTGWLGVKVVSLGTGLDKIEDWKCGRGECGCQVWLMYTCEGLNLGSHASIAVASHRS